MAKNKCITNPDHPPLNRPVAGGHGYYGSPTYVSWLGMVQRTTNPLHLSYANYGGRGIKVCPDWKGSFIAFLRDVGERPSRAHTLDRVNNNGDYEPGNVRWATKKEQAANRRPRRRHFRKTHCAQGHEFTSENTRIQKSGIKAGRRHCMLCQNVWRAKARAARH